MPQMPQIPKPADLVLISWERNPLRPGSMRRIVQSCVIGSARPCEDTLRDGGLLSSALRCLVRNGFVIFARGRTTSVSGFVLLVRR
ncbi:hypothetical protein [Collibacillus ludicampi]|uniref:hypothetical protein n=1 Tax=Collibacillus ludicampi TaxID=2771369 RepID=UPI002495715F|nr:hypothetical protein [Collibacillus ludicampi]